MDKQLASLDPKVQETYHRVMSTPTQSVKPVQATPQVPPVASPPPAVPQAPTTPTQPTQQAPEQVFTPQVATEARKEESVNVQVPTPPPTINETNSQVFNSRKKPGQISPVIMIMGVMVFFAVYTLVWVKIFNARLPFLP